MNRLHVHVNVADLEQSVRFYSTLFGAAPTVRKPDYAKWMLDDPRVNFAISHRGRAPGVDHLGIQVESRDALGAIASRLHEAEIGTLGETGTTCCYAKSDKEWTVDPSGLRWETFHSFGESTEYGVAAPDAAMTSACCAPKALSGAATESSACCGPTGDASPSAPCCGPKAA
jgi:catechol 2,3-dioxygenase-like lactoylglutathione lyase family enzyme